MSLALLLPALLAAPVAVPPTADLGAAVRAARAGDVLQLEPGVYSASFGRVRLPLRISGAGAGVTVVLAPEGEDGLVVEAGEVRLEGLTLRVQGRRTALKVLGGQVHAAGVALIGGASGAFVGNDGRLDGSDVELSGDWGLLLQAGEVSLADVRARGTHAGIAQLGGRSRLRRLAVVGPSIEAGLSYSGGEALIEDAVVRSPGPTGLSVTGSARVEARALDISGATETQGKFLGDCVQLRRGTFALSGGTLTRCGGAAVEGSAGEAHLRGVDASGGEAGCLVFVDKAQVRLEGNRCLRGGPGIVAASGAQVRASMNRWLVDPVLWVECGSGARVYLGVGETSREPCRKPGDSLDKTPRP